MPNNIGLTYDLSAGADSIRTLDQSASSSSASSMGREVVTPWPISERSTTTSTLSSVPMRSQAFGANGAAAAGRPALPPAAGRWKPMTRLATPAASRNSRRVISGAALISRSLGGAMDGGADPLVGAAATDVGHGRVDVGVGGMRILREQRSRGHDLPRLAIAALGHVFFDPGALHRVRPVFRQAFDRGHPFAGDIIALAGALTFGELCARRRRAGGGYVYLREAFGPLPAFLYGWALLLVIATGATAAVAVTFASYAVPLLGLSPSARLPLAIGVIVVVSAVNYVGVRPAAVTQNVFTVLKLAALAALIVAGLWFSPSTAFHRPPPHSTAPVGMWAVGVALGAALVPVLFAYGGWQQTNFIAEELVAPERDLPRALVLGVVGVVAVYLLVNVAYLRVLGAAGLAASTAPAADVMARVVGPGGTRLISAGIAVSTFGFLNLVILVTPRVFQAMAADGLFLTRLAALHPTYRSPAGALVFTGAGT